MTAIWMGLTSVRSAAGRMKLDGDGQTSMQHGWAEPVRGGEEAGDGRRACEDATSAMQPLSRHART